MITWEISPVWVKDVCVLFYFFCEILLQFAASVSLSGAPELYAHFARWLIRCLQVPIFRIHLHSKYCEIYFKNSFDVNLHKIALRFYS